MKTIYYCECDSNNSTGLDLVFWLNEKAMATFTKRKTAKEWLIDRYHFIKDWFAEDIKSTSHPTPSPALPGKGRTDAPPG